MSTAASATAGNLNTADEIQKYHTFVTLAIFLAAITGIEIVVIYIEPLSWWVVATILLVLSTIKFICVVTWFMHLIYDRFVTTMIFAAGLSIGGTIAAALVVLHTTSYAFTLEEMQEQQENYPLPTVVTSSPATD